MEGFEENLKKNLNYVFKTQHNSLNSGTEQPRQKYHVLSLSRVVVSSNKTFLLVSASLVSRVQAKLPHKQLPSLARSICAVTLSQYRRAWSVPQAKAAKIFTESAWQKLWLFYGYWF